MPVIIDRLTGQVRAAQIFVAVLGASNFTYADAPDRSHRIDHQPANLSKIYCQQGARQPGDIISYSAGDIVGIRTRRTSRLGVEAVEKRICRGRRADLRSQIAAGSES